MGERMKDSNRGYTFIEIIIVLVIVSVLAVVSVPAVRAYYVRYKFRSTVIDTVLDLQMAKMSSVKLNNYVVIQVEDTGYTIYADNGADGGQEGDWIRQDGERILAKYIMPQGISISSNFTKDQTRFTGQLGMKAGRIFLENAEGSKAEVILSFNGRIRTE
jgi:prepilin-type N-terminal cleavage/methylation domain-containing protein